MIQCIEDSGIPQMKWLALDMHSVSLLVEWVDNRSHPLDYFRSTLPFHELSCRIIQIVELGLGLGLKTTHHTTPLPFPYNPTLPYPIHPWIQLPISPPAFLHTYLPEPLCSGCQRAQRVPRVPQCMVLPTHHHSHTHGGGRRTRAGNRASPTHETPSHCPAVAHRTRKASALLNTCHPKPCTAVQEGNLYSGCQFGLLQPTS